MSTKPQEIVEQTNTELAAITPPQMLALAVQQGADLDKLEKLMDLQERWEKNEAHKAYVVAMSAFRESCPTIDRTRKGHNGKYAGLAETLEQIKKLMGDNGLSHSWTTQQHENDLVTVICRVTHVQGHAEETSLSAGPDKSGSKNSIQAIGSTVAYLERYTLFALLGLASKEMDDDGGKADNLITANQAADIACKLDELGADVPKFLGYMEVDAIENIPAKDFQKAINALNRKATQK